MVLAPPAADFADGTACEDGLFCIKDTTCLAGVCQGGVPKCPPANNSADCGASTVTCTEDYGGHCITTTTNPCSSLGDACNIGVCDTKSNTCKKVAANNGDSCDDGKYCTTDDKCNCGKCQGKPLVCSITQTVNQCTKVVCSEDDDACKEVNKDNGTPCDAGSGLCSADTCQEGVCTAGTPKNCTAYDSQCTQGICKPNTGKCEAKSINGEH